MKSKNKQIVRDLINKSPAKKIKNIIKKTAAEVKKFMDEKISKNNTVSINELEKSE